MSQNKTLKKIPEGMVNLLENTIASLMMESKVPGLSIAVVINDQVIYSKGFGARNLELNLPATPNTIYGFGSCTKSYTALAIMQLVQDGKINLNDPINKYLDFKLGTKKNPITIHHLLTHSSGIPDLGLVNVIGGRILGVEEFWVPMSSWDDFFTHINGASQEVAADPGQRFAYLNEGYTLLGAIVEKVSGMKFEDYMKEKILKPLKMERSTFKSEEFEKQEDRMTPYFAKNRQAKIESVTPTPFLNSKFVYAPGGLLSSVMDQAKYLIANMNGGVFDKNRVLNEDLLNEMHKIHIETELVRNELPDFQKEGYGYGWLIIEDFFGEKAVIHTGDTIVSTAFVGFIPSKKIGVACACNSGSGSSVVIVVPLLIMTFLLGKDPTKDLKFLEIDQKLSMLTGVYETYKGLDRVTVVKKGALLFLEPEDKLTGFNLGVSTPIIPKSNDLKDYKFYIMSGSGGKTSVDFSIDAKRKIDLYIERRRFHKVKDLPLAT